MADYLKAGHQTGVRADIAFAQSVVETGYFSFPAYGQDAPGYNNFAGIGACDTCAHGWRFSSAMSGVLGQQNLLAEYAWEPGNGPSGGRSKGNGIQGCCHTWMSLAGTWASNPLYGYDILAVYREMLDWTLQQELQANGLTVVAPTAGAAAIAANRPAKS